MERMHIEQQKTQEFPGPQGGPWAPAKAHFICMTPHNSWQ